jgi:hypothetical protein
VFHSVRARFVAVAIPIAAAVVAAVAGGAWSQPGDPPAPPPPRDITTVPASSAGVSCPSGWTGFENPVLRYSVCYPSAWGFTDLAGAEPLPAVPTRSMRNLRLLSANGFPWVAGTSTFDAVARGVTEVELNAMQPGAIFENECAPVANASGLLSCEQSLDGSIKALKVVVPLASGAQLLVIVRSSTSQEVDHAWQIVRSIRPL